MTHNLDATVFVYRNNKDKTIKAEYFEKARLLEDSPDWDHIATLEPRIWIEFNYDTIAKPEQEPVAWMDSDGNVSDNNDHGCFSIPLYTFPPQRTWVDLTDEDKQIAFDDTQEGGGFWEFADAIEAKLKEKNT